MNENLPNDSGSARPFAMPLETSPHDVDNTGKLFSIARHPEVVLRREDIDISTKEKLDTQIENIKKAKELFSLLSSQYGMNIAETSYVVGQNSEGQGESYALVETISGKNLCDLEIIDKQAKKEIDICFSRYLMYMLHALENGGEYWSDMNSQQVVYGTRQGEDVPHAYVVDIDPITQLWMNSEERFQDTHNAIRETTSVVSELTWLVVNIVGLESKLVDGGRLDTSREKMKMILCFLGPIVEKLNDTSLTEIFAVLDRNFSL